MKKYAEDSAKTQVELAKKEAQTAAEAAGRAEAAIVHPPIPDPATGNWMRWDQLTEEYVVTDIRAEGQDFEIRGFYPSFEALQEAVPDPKKGWAYGIGTEAPYEIYVWDAVGGDWKNNDLHMTHSIRTRTSLIMPTALGFLLAEQLGRFHLSQRRAPVLWSGRTRRRGWDALWLGKRWSPHWEPL